jgi:hypothetical protein
LFCLRFDILNFRKLTYNKSVDYKVKYGFSHNFNILNLTGC